MGHQWRRRPAARAGREAARRGGRRERPEGIGRGSQEHDRRDDGVLLDGPLLLREVEVGLHRSGGRGNVVSDGAGTAGAGPNGQNLGWQRASLGAGVGEVAVAGASPAGTRGAGELHLAHVSLHLLGGHGRLASAGVVAELVAAHAAHFAVGATSGPGARAATGSTAVARHVARRSRWRRAGLVEGLAAHLRLFQAGGVRQGSLGGE